MSHKFLSKVFYRKIRVRKKIFGNMSCPRLSVYRSLKHVYAQIIDDQKGRTLAFASSLEPAVREQLKSGGNAQAAMLVGKLIAQKSLNAQIKKVVFDRGGRIFHGRLKAVAAGARENGLEF